MGEHNMLIRRMLSSLGTSKEHDTMPVASSVDEGAVVDSVVEEGSMEESAMEESAMDESAMEEGVIKEKLVKEVANKVGREGFDGIFKLLAPSPDSG